MAFDKKLLSMNSAGFGASPRIFGYGITSDTIATIILDGYFLEAGKELRVGDWLNVVSDAVSPLPAAILIVQTIVLDVNTGEVTDITVSQLV